MNQRTEQQLIVVVRPAERQDCEDIYNLSRTQLSTIQSAATETENQQTTTARGDDDELRRPRLMSAKELERDGFDTAPPLFHCLVATRTTTTATASTSTTQTQEQQKMKNDGADERSSHNYSHSQSLASSSPSHISIVGYALYFISYPVWEGKSIQLVNFCIDPTYDGDDRARIGASLLRELAKVTIDGGFADIRMECQYWNAPDVKLLEENFGHDFTAKEGWNSFKIDEHGLQQLIRL